MAMFARRRDVLEREAERIGALAVRGDVTQPARPRARRSRQTVDGVRRRRHPRLERRRPAAGPGDRRRRAEQSRRPSSCCSSPPCGSSTLCLPHLEQSGRRPDRRDRVGSPRRSRPTHLALSNARPARRRRLGEDARARARPARHHGQLRSRRPDRRPTRLAQLYPGGPTDDRARARSRCGASARRTRSPTSSASSPPTALATSPGTIDRRRRRAAREASSDAESRSAVARLAACAWACSRLAVVTCSCSGPAAVERLHRSSRTTAHPVAPLVQVAGGHEPNGRGRHLLRRRHRAQGVAARAALRRARTTAPTLVPGERRSCRPGVSDSAAASGSTCAEMTNSQQVAAAVALRAARLQGHARVRAASLVAAIDDRRARGRASSSPTT